MISRALVEKVDGSLTKEVVQCEECGKAFLQVTNSHVKNRHGMTMEEYVKKHPTAKLVSEVAKNFGDNNPMADPEVRKRWEQAVTSDEHREKMKRFVEGTST